jgi:hypothetical protein
MRNELNQLLERCGQVHAHVICGQVNRDPITG